MPHRLASSLRFFIALLCLCLALAAPNAHAGTYVGDYTDPVTATPSQYTGGFYGTLVNGQPKTLPDSTANSGQGSGYGGGSGGPAVGCTKDITTSFHWVADAGKTQDTDPPPSQVIVMQTCTVCVSAPTSGSSASYATGLGSGGHVSYSPGGTNSVQVTDTRYGVVAGAKTVTLPALSASATMVGSSGFGCSLSYTATITPVFVAPSGTYNPAVNDNRVLTCQQITAMLQGIPGNFTVTHYTWSVGGSAFKTYDPTLASNQLVPLASADLVGPAAGGTTVSPLKFYDRAAENLTVTCAVILTAPDGTSLSLTATSPTINVLKPTVSWTIYTGYVQQVYSPSQGQGEFALKPAPGSTQAGGEAWSNTTIVFPPPFTSAGGSGCFAQLITPDTEIKNDDPTKNPTYLNNKQQGLDNSFPYKGYNWDVSGVGANSDGPAILFENYNSSGYAGYNLASENDNLTTWVMYQPPGGVWVPLQNYKWTWSFTSKWDGNLNQWFLFRASPANAKADPKYKGADTPDPPQWSLVQNNTPPPS